MRNFFTITILVLYQINGYCQTDSSKNEVIIIGTIHTGNKNFNHKTLYLLLDSLMPDIILDEDSEIFKPVFGLKTATFLKFLKPSIEQLALQTFSKRNRNIIILPFDTAFAIKQSSKNQVKNEILARKQYIKNQIKLEAAIFDSLQIVTKDFIDSLNLANSISKRYKYYESFNDKNLKEINEPTFYNIAGDLYKDDEELILPLIKKYLKDTILIKEFEKDLVFWDKRNKYMVRKIESISELHPKKRIIVLTGLNHKYFLIKKLSNQINQ
jgi:hypothetical protein